MRLVPTALLLLGLSACGTTKSIPPPPTEDWVVTARAPLLSGVALEPFDASQPGEAGPQALAFANGQIFVADTNLYEEEKPAGPSFLSVHDPKTLARVEMIPLVLGTGASAVVCTNAGAMTVSGDNLLIACAGLLPQPPAMPNGGMLAVVSASQQVVTQIVPTGGSPGAVAQSGNNIWLADSASPSLLQVDATTWQLINGPGVLSICQPVQAGGNYAASLLITEGRGFAACFNDDTIQEFDPTTGALVGSPVSTGASIDGPVWLASVAGDLVVVGSDSGTVGFASLASTPITWQTVTIGGSTVDLQDLDGDASFAAVANSTAGSLDILDVTAQFKLVAAVSTKDSADAGSNDPYGVIDVDGVFYVTAAGWSTAPEVLRIARVDGGT